MRRAGFLPAVIAAVWLGPLLWNAAGIPTDVGFDARHHVAYVDFLTERAELPLATDGWSMFHPPLYYGATAAAVAMSGGAPGAWKFVGIVAGLTSALLAAWLAGTGPSRASAAWRLLAACLWRASTASALAPARASARIPVRALDQPPARIYINTNFEELPI